MVMGITDILFITILTCSALLAYQIALIEKDIKELEELLKKNKRL